MSGTTNPAGWQSTGRDARCNELRCQCTRCCFPVQLWPELWLEGVSRVWAALAHRCITPLALMYELGCVIVCIMIIMRVRLYLYYVGNLNRDVIHACHALNLNAHTDTHPLQKPLLLTVRWGHRHSPQSYSTSEAHKDYCITRSVQGFRGAFYRLSLRCPDFSWSW